jgi:hypothetical protein
MGKNVPRLGSSSFRFFGEKMCTFYNLLHNAKHVSYDSVHYIKSSAILQLVLSSGGQER